jgi:hypothetical protein
MIRHMAEALRIVDGARILATELQLALNKLNMVADAQGPQA